jgi:hypothetical protein
MHDESQERRSQGCWFSQSLASVFQTLASSLYEYPASKITDRSCMMSFSILEAYDRYNIYGMHYEKNTYEMMPAFWRYSGRRY